MKDTSNQLPVKYRKDYRPSDYLIERTELCVRLFDDRAEVESRLLLKPNPEGQPSGVLTLDGVDLELLEIALNDTPLTGGYEQTDEQLIVHNVPDAPFTLQTTVRIFPHQNTLLEGLYASGGKFCTQCEAEGFRRITFYLDRPDVLSVFTTRIEAERDAFPYLLSNGNRIATGHLPEGRHYAVWEDPFPKPSYLFALVAGDFDVLEDEYITMSGRKVRLVIYVDRGKLDQCHHAMASLKRAMAWDERRFGREYDLDIYMIVAVSDFNMGAMENKGLNIFNTKYILASERTATDDDLIAVESVVAHEYFHNWTGNRITCRDWFQLSLKEGLTVFRDQEFTSDLHSRGVKRIEDVKVIRGPQFTEDASPMAHPIRPDEYVEMNNFYTVTVYNKGAEVIRMIHTLLGEDGFRKGMDLYFERHDGQAVTCEDFVRCMEDATQRDLTQFRRWYAQAGTPVVEVVHQEYDTQKKQFRLVLRQSCPPTPKQPEKLPFHIPIRLALFAEDGEKQTFAYQGRMDQECLLELHESEQTFLFEQVEKPPVPSLLRGFTAPVRLYDGSGPEMWTVLAAHDDDPFCRWDAGQRLMSALVWQCYDEASGEQLADRLGEALRHLAFDDKMDPAFRSLAMTWPSFATLSSEREAVAPFRLWQALDAARKMMAHRAMGWTYALSEMAEAKVAQVDEDTARGWRSLANCARYWSGLAGDQNALVAWQQKFDRPDNMTNELSAFRFLVHHVSDVRDSVIETFYQRWRDEALVIDKWFTVQASIPKPESLQLVEALWTHPDMRRTNPNRVRALIGGVINNPAVFHRPDGAGYRWLAERVVEMDAINPQVAARIVQPLAGWRRFEAPARNNMKSALEAIASSIKSRDVGEIVERSLDDSQ
ncbi:MAG: aminopeptidase N [Gammaproteobacteria bacterium]|nr:MAG: aminopeptidase N [Gammaproteobacteria bacterium]